MPSVPADAGAFFDENDLANLDGVLDFDVPGGGALGQSGNFGGPNSGYIMDVDRANTTGDADHAGGLNTSSEDLDFYGSDHGDDRGGGSGTKEGKGKKGHGRRHSGESFEIGSGADQVDVSDLDPKDPKYRRRIQNRMASARFRAKAKERQQELDRLKSQVTQLRREKADLEAQCRNLNVMIESAAEQHRTSTMAWIVDHFWLRRKVHFKTLANSVRWMVRGQYRKGMTDAVLRAKLAAEGIVREEESSHARGDEMNDDSDVSMDDAGYDKNRPEERLANSRGNAGGGRGLGERTAGAAGDGPDGAPTLSPNTSWKLWATLQKLGSFGRSKPPVDPDTGDPINRPYTR